MYDVNVRVGKSEAHLQTSSLAVGISEMIGEALGIANLELNEVQIEQAGNTIVATVGFQVGKGVYQMAAVTISRVRDEG